MSRGYGNGDHLYTDSQICEVIKILAAEGRPPTQHILRNRFKMPCTPWRLRDLKSHLEATGQIPAIEPKQRYATKNAAGVPYKGLVASSPSPERPKPKMPWRPIYARNWSEAQMIRLKATLDAVHDFRVAWKHLHLPPKEQHVIGTNRCNGTGQSMTVVPESRRKPNPKLTNPVQALSLNDDAPPWHPKGDGI